MAEKKKPQRSRGSARGKNHGHPRPRHQTPLDWKAFAKKNALAVDEYLAGVDVGIVDMVLGLRALVRKTVPRLREYVRYGHLVYSGHRVVIYLQANKERAELGFYWGAEIRGSALELEGRGGKIRHLRYRASDAVPTDDLAQVIHAADLHDRELQSLSTRTQRRAR